MSHMTLSLFCAHEFHCLVMLVIMLRISGRCYRQSSYLPSVWRRRFFGVADDEQAPIGWIAHVPGLSSLDMRDDRLIAYDELQILCIPSSPASYVPAT